MSSYIHYATFNRQEAEAVATLSLEGKRELQIHKRQRRGHDMSAFFERESLENELS